MTLPELITLATSTLNSVPHHPAVTPELCAAICWVESSGNPNATGDKGAAYGLAQFHRATWRVFAKRPCPVHAGARPDHQLHAFCPDCSMRALVTELSYAARRVPSFKARDLMFVRRWLCRFHNAGRFDDANTVYCRNVAKVIESLSTPRQAKRSSPPLSGSPRVAQRPATSSPPASATQPAEVASR